MAVALDASALLAYLRAEPGGQTVADEMANEAFVSAANLAEVLAKVADRGADPDHVVQELRRRQVLDGVLHVVDMTVADAIMSARLRAATATKGLSLGDRACLALASRLSLPALTADRAWDGLAVDVDVRLIR